VKTERVPPRIAFAFRGERDYLHSTTVFDFLLQHDSAPEDIEFIFHGMTSRQCECLAAQDSESPNTQVATYRSAGLTCFLYESDAPITSRYACNEKSILEHIAIDQSTARFRLPPVEGATYIEAVVAAYKDLLLRSVPEFSGKPMFGRINLQYVPTEGNCQVRHRRVMGGKFFQADLAHQEQPIGKLYYGVR
jgi:hypothetical protein